MKSTYDVIINTRGILDMRHGVHEDTYRFVHGASAPFPEEDYEIIETPRCFLRVLKSNLTRDDVIRHIRGHFYVLRISPHDQRRVQISSEAGHWRNYKFFNLPESAFEFVKESNSQLLPFIGSPYLAQEVPNDD